jgi:DNA-binding transcriptional MerR regulator
MRVAWSITAVAKMSGVTSRTLRHYDVIGLLPPAWIGGNGYRYYEDEQLLRLQQILVLRELGVGLSEIAGVLDAETDQLSALRRHHTRLLAERERLTRLARTVARTIAELEKQEGGDSVAKIKNPYELFDGLDPEQARAWDAEARERWGSEQVDESHRRLAGLTKEDAARIQRDSAAINVRMAELMAAGTPVDDPVVLEAVDRHYRWVCNFWTPDRQAYIGLGNLYTDDERFKKNYEDVRTGLAAYMRAAMAAYAQVRLG